MSDSMSIFKILEWEFRRIRNHELERGSGYFSI